MSDIIKLLPDSVANQIAAGEVIQRPASVVKELLENSIDAGSTEIQLVVKDAGKTLIQVIDNGCGMSETDARLSFERHATSKISQANDLFKLKTKGFRGEALASIAAIAHVELKSKRQEDQLGVELNIEGSEVKKHEPVNTQSGSIFSVKNLFFNVPARRNFLKSDQVEMRHIIEEFTRVALTHPEVEFKLIHNGNEVYHLPEDTLRKRIVNLFGKNHNQRLVPIDEETGLAHISGFIGKPEFARKTRGEQFFFVNKRYIKSNYLHHAIKGAYEGLINADQYPSYFIYFDIDPERIDINIHPTKTEIKFEDERAIYAILKSTVKNSLGKFNITPTLDFEQEASFDTQFDKNKAIVPPQIKVNPEYNPFEQSSNSGGTKSQGQPSGSGQQSTDGWQDLYEIRKPAIDHSGSEQEHESADQIAGSSQGQKFMQVQRKYIMSPIRSGLIFIHQQRAHERILFEKFLQSLAHNKGYSQQQLFPEKIELSPSEIEQIKEIEPELSILGFKFENFEKNSITITGAPPEAMHADLRQLIENILNQFQFNVKDLNVDKRKELIQSMARNLSIRTGQLLNEEEMQSLTDQLFSCETPGNAPGGLPTMFTFTSEEIDKKFGL